MISASERGNLSSNRRWLRDSATCCVLVAALFSGRPARAEDAETRTAARDLATQGAKAFDAGKYEDAADFFRRAYDLVHAPSIGIMRARSLVKVGQLVEAIDAYEQTSRFKLVAGAPDAYVKAVQAAKSEMEEVRARVPRVKITLKGADPNEAPSVTIDEKPTPAALLGVERPLNPGEHRLAVVVGSETRSTRMLDVKEGQTYDFELDASAHAAGPVESTLPPAEMPERKPTPLAPEPPPNTEPAPTKGSSTRVLGYVGLGVGALGLGIGTYTGLVALHDKSRLDDVCHPQCPQSSASDLSGFRSNRTISWVSYGVGVAAVTTGILLLTVGDSKHEHASLAVSPFGVQIGGAL